jgi:hypothetical protein
MKLGVRPVHLELLIRCTKPTILYLARKRLSVIAIHSGLLATISPEAVGYSSVTVYFRDVKFPASNPPASSAKLKLELDDCDQALLLALAGQMR